MKQTERETLLNFSNTSVSRCIDMYEEASIARNALALNMCHVFMNEQILPMRGIIAGFDVVASEVPTEITAVAQMVKERHTKWLLVRKNAITHSSFIDNVIADLQSILTDVTALQPVPAHYDGTGLIGLIAEMKEDFGAMDDIFFTHEYLNKRLDNIAARIDADAKPAKPNDEDVPKDLLLQLLKQVTTYMTDLDKVINNKMAAKDEYRTAVFYIRNELASLSSTIMGFDYDEEKPAKTNLAAFDPLPFITLLSNIADSYVLQEKHYQCQTITPDERGNSVPGVFKNTARILRNIVSDMSIAADAKPAYQTTDNTY